MDRPSEPVDPRVAGGGLIHPAPIHPCRGWRGVETRRPLQAEGVTFVLPFAALLIVGNGGCRPKSPAQPQVTPRWSRRGCLGTIWEHQS